MNRFRNHCLLRTGSLRLVITYFDPLGVGLLFVFFAVLFLILGSKGSGDFAVEGGKFGFEDFKFVFFAPCARQDGFEGRHIDTFFIGTLPVLADCVGEFFKSVYEVHAGGMGV